MSRYYDDFTDECAALATSLMFIFVLVLLYELLLLIPAVFKLAVALTGGLLGWLDEALDGRLSEDEVLALLAAGGIWTLIPLLLILPLILPLALSEGLAACMFVPMLLLPSFIFGLACGYQALQEGDLATEERQALSLDGLLSLPYEGYGDLEGLLAEGVILGEETTEDWFLG